VKKRITLNRMVLMIIIGLLLVPAGNLWAGLIPEASDFAYFQSPEDWNDTGHAPPPPFDMDSIKLEWSVYDRDFAGPGGLGPASIAASVPDSANYVTTFRVYNENDTPPVVGLGLTSLAFLNVSLEPMPTTTTTEGVGVVLDGDNFMFGIAMPMPTVINPFGGALVSFPFSGSPLGAGMNTGLGWMASLLGPDQINAIAEVSWASASGETNVIEVASIFGDDPNYTTDVPEPATLLLLGSGLLLCGILRRKFAA
jgi:hypothetical protein